MNSFFLYKRQNSTYSREKSLQNNFVWYTDKKVGKNKGRYLYCESDQNLSILDGVTTQFSEILLYNRFIFIIFYKN